MRGRFAVVLVAVLVAACTTSPLGRSQLRLFPEQAMASMGVSAFTQLKQKGSVGRSGRTNEYVECVARAITAELGDGAGAWEVVVFEEDSANAFALPGKKIGVHTGLLDVAGNQDQLAAVIGHEVAHVVAHHGNERYSAGVATQVGMQVAASALDIKDPKVRLGLAALGLGLQVGVLLPYGRAHESEADLLGLDLMARAGFDPRQSIELWKNMSAAGGAAPPEFLSTHPSHTTRIGGLRKRLDLAVPLYERARATGKRPNCRP